MITKKTCIEIWTAYNEIEVGLETLENLEEAIKDGRQPDLRDGFGRALSLMLGYGDLSSRRSLCNVRPELAASVIRAHIADQRRRLVEANERARIEIDQIKCQEESGEENKDDWVAVK
jgi:hypothetical protein